MDRQLIDELLGRLRRFRDELDGPTPDLEQGAELARELGRLRDRIAARTGSLETDHVEQGDFLAGILVHSPVIISILDRDGNFLYVSRSAPGEDARGIAGHESAAFFNADQEALWQQVIRRTVETELPQHIELSSASGYFWDNQVVPIKRDNRVTWLLAIAQDISAQKQVEAALELKEQQLEVALEASRMGLWSWRIPDDHVTWDTAAKRIFDWPEDSDKIGYADFLRRVHPSDRERVKQSVAAAVESGEYPDLACRIVLPDGSHRWIVCKGKVLSNAAGQAERLVGGVMDISQGKQSEVQQQRSQKLEAIGQLAGGVAHDFNNLLVAILGNASLAKNASSDSEREEFLNELIAAGNRAAALTRQLLVFSRRQPLDETVLDINSLLSDTTKLLARLLPENIRFELNPGNEVPLVLGDRGQLEQLVVNLCVNARDAMPNGGLLVVATGRMDVLAEQQDRPAWAKPGSYAFIEIMDSGSGISPEILEHVFEPFFTTKAEGSGLGLATAYGVSKRHGGFISVQSRVGQGTRFRVHLPDSQALAPTPQPSWVVNVEGGHETILLAEDEASVRAVVERILERAGYQVISAEDGAQAVQLYRQRSDEIDLVLLDVVMPHMSGVEALSEILELKPVAAVLCSGYSDAPDRLLEFEQPVAFVTKPYEPDQLLNVVRSQLDEQTGRS